MATLDERLAQLRTRLPAAGQPASARAVVEAFVEVARVPLPRSGGTGLLMLDLRKRGESLVLCLGHDFYTGEDIDDDLQALTLEGDVVGFEQVGTAFAPVSIYMDGDGEHPLDRWVDAVHGHPVIQELTSSSAVISGWVLDGNIDD